MKKTDAVSVRCPRCLGRGYIPEKRRPSKRNPNGTGFYARTCPRCRGGGRAQASKQEAVDEET